MGMALDEPRENEKPIQINGVGVLISEFGISNMDDTTIDYVTKTPNEGFTITGSGKSC